MRSVAGMLRAALTAATLIVACPATATSSGPGRLEVGRGAPVTAAADLIVHNGRIVTMDDARPEAQALAAKAGRIVALGTDAEILANHAADTTTIVDLRGRLAIPGFIEGHGHFAGLGESKMNLDLAGVPSWEAVIAMVADAVRRAKPGEWIVGRGWHQEKWTSTPPGAVEGFPIHDALSAASPDNPVWLTHASGHAGFANARAMADSGISADTPDPDGGEILRDRSGLPTGLFRQNAQRLIQVRDAAGALSPRAQFERMDRAIDLAVQACLEHGVTTFQDAGSTFPVIDRLAERARAGTLGVRLWVMIRTDIELIEEHAERYRSMRRIGDDRLTVGGIKFAIDGALGSRGAWLLEPYSDSPDRTGFITTPMATLERAAAVAMRTGLQLCIHAIGDRGNREALDLFERAFRRASPDARSGTGRRWRIEHAQHLDPDDIPRFARLGVVASMQAVHCTSDGPWVASRLGTERAGRGAYMWRALLDSGAVVSNGSDVPVESIDPIAGLAAAVTRRLPDGTQFFPAQRMTRMEALRSYTRSAAHAAFEEDIKGTLMPGMLADIAVLSEDFFDVPDEAIDRLRVDLTIVGGRIAWQRPLDS